MSLSSTVGGGVGMDLISLVVVIVGGKVEIFIGIGDRRTGNSRKRKFEEVNK